MEPMFSHGVERKEMTDSWWYLHGPCVRRRCHCCINLSVVSLAFRLLTHLLADKANAVGLLTKTLWIRKCQGEKAEWNWNGKEWRCGGVMQRVWSREGWRLGTVWSSPGLCGLNTWEENMMPPPALLQSELERQARHISGRHSMSGLFISWLGAKVWEIGKRKFGFDSRTEKQEGQGSGVTCKVTWLVCFLQPGPPPIDIVGRQIYFFSCSPSVLEASLSVFLYRPWCPGSITWPRTLHRGVSIQAVCLFSIPLLLLLPGRFPRRDLWRWKGFQNLFCVNAARFQLQFFNILKSFGQEYVFSFHKRDTVLSIHHIRRHILSIFPFLWMLTLIFGLKWLSILHYQVAIFHFLINKYLWRRYSELFRVLPTTFNIHGWLLPKSVASVVVTKWSFKKNFIISSKFCSWDSTVRKSFSFSLITLCI